MMGSSTPLLDVLSAHLPGAIASAELSSLPSQSRSFLETLLAFGLGAECPPRLTVARHEWSRSQTAALKALQTSLGPSKLTNTKHPRDSPDTDDDPNSKRPRTSDDADDAPRFTLPSVSATSPVRKKVDVTVHARSIRLVHPTTRALEYSAPLSTVVRAFMVPTRGKTKSHWTVVLLPADAPDKAKSTSPSAPQQIIFGIDARSPAAFETTSYSNASGTPNAFTTTIAKGEETAPSVRQLLSHLPVPLLQPSATVFRSACATPSSGDGAAGIDAYLSAKSGTLWFLDTGILWGESKPCTFWAVEDLLAKDGVRLISATGRTCSVTLSRKVPTSGPGSGAKDDEESDDEEEIVETVFSMVEGREQDPISAWARNRKHLFGKLAVANGSPSGPASKHVPAAGPTTIKGAVWDDSDSDDEDFEMASSEDLEHSSNSDSDGSGGDGGSADGENDDRDSNASEVEESDEEELHPAQQTALDKMAELLRGGPEDELSDEEDELDE